MNQNREMLMSLLDGQEESLPIIHDILAEHHLSETAYAKVFELVNFTMPTDASDTVAYCAATKEWKKGTRTISDIKLFGLLDRVCDIIRLYVRTSWDECIFSAWVSDKAETAMTSMEELAHIRNVLKLASSSMVYSSDGTLDWGEDAGQDAD